MFSPFFYDDPFGYQPRMQRRRNNVPFFMDEEEEVPQYHNAPQRQRQAPVNPQRFQQASPNARQQSTQKHPQTTKRNVPHRVQKNPVKARPKMPDLETCHRAAAKIQKVFRGYQVRKLQLIPKLKQLTKVEQEFKLLNMKFQHVTEVLQQLWTKNIEELDLINYRITHKKLLECEEEMTKKLISLDSISSGQSQLIRTTRKQIVESISIALQQLEPVKKASLQKLQQLQEYHAKREQQRLDEQARQQEVQNANTTAELDPKELPGNPFFSSEDEASSEGPETVATVFEPMEEQSDEEASEEMAIENSKNASESHSSMNTYDLVTLSSMGYEAIQQLLERQSRLLQDKDNSIKQLQARIEQLEQRTPAAATL